MGSLQQIPGSGQAQEHAPVSSRERELKAAFIGRYEILGELGRGAMGVVYQAHDRVIGRTVALKMIAVGHDAPDHDEVIERLKSEAKAAGSLDHPNIITIYDVGHDGDRVYLSMQFVEGSTLAAILSGENLIPGALTLLNYAEQICNAVAFAHERCVVHRDLKPSNLMLTPQGQIKVLDFGIAKKGDASLTKSGMVVGTPSYMAPEQATGKDVDQRADIFALGAVFYELFTGQKAFHADTVAAVLYKVVHEAPEPPVKLNPALSPGVDAAIRRALEKDPKDRFQSCIELRDTLRKEAVLLRTTSARILAKPLLESGNHERIAGARRKSRRVVPILLSACFLLAMAAVILWPQRAKFPRVMGLISHLKQFGSRQSKQETFSSSPQMSAGAQSASKPEATAGTPSAAVTPADTTGKPTGQDSTSGPTQPGTPASPSASLAGNQPAKSGGPETAASTTSPQPASPQPAANVASTLTLATPTRETKNEPSPPVVTEAEENPTSDGPTSKAADPGDAVPKRVKPAAPALVEGFTRKDIPDLLRKADAAAGSGDYRSARYEFDIVLRLDRQNAHARDGLRRAREAEKERR